MATKIHGFCDEPFQPLKDAFAANFADGLDVGASVAVMRHGRPVVDLWAGHADMARTRPWEENTIVAVASNTKIATALCLLMLVDRGLVDLDLTVATYWPEFAAGGKGHVTIREAMSHRGGVPGLDPPVTFEAIRDWAGITTRIASEPHWFGGEDRLCYHYSTYGFLLGAIIRRVDGRGPARFFREEVAAKAGVDLQIGLNSMAERDRLAVNCFLTPPEPPGFDDLLVQRVVSSVPLGDYGAWEHQYAELPSGGGFANARALARLAAIFANGGELDGVRYLSKPLVDAATTEQVFQTDPLFGPLRMGFGFGLDSEGFPAPTPSAFHWGGRGGSLICGDQKTGISFGFAANNLVMLKDPRQDRRFLRLWAALGEVMAGAAEALA